MKEKILIVALDNLGDAVMATSLLKPLKSIEPNVFIGFWVKDYVAPLFIDHPLIDQLHASDPFWDVSPGRGKGSIRSFLHTAREIKKINYDTALILNTEWRRSLACALMRIPERIGYNRRKSRFFLTTSVPFDKSPVHFIERHKTLCSALTGPSNPMEFLPYIPALRLTTADEIVVHPFAGDQEKCWPIEKWGDLMGEIKNIFPEIKFRVICTKKESALLTATPIPTFNGVTMWAEKPLYEVKEAIARARLFIGGDSGPGHIAAAEGVPTISLFGVTNPLLCGPRGSNSIWILQKNPLTDLPVSEVIQVVRQALGKTGST